MYAGALGDNAVERYAMFLTSLELSADIAERRLALTRARDHGLDMERVAVATAERTIEKAFSVRATHCSDYYDLSFKWDSSSSLLLAAPYLPSLGHSPQLQRRNSSLCDLLNGQHSWIPHTTLRWSRLTSSSVTS